MRAAAIVLMFGLLVPAAGARAQEATAPPRLPSIALPAGLERVLRDYERAWAVGDEAALAALFTDDGFIPDAAGWVRGRDRIRQQYADSRGPLVLRAHAYAVADSVGYIVGAYGYGPTATEIDTGKFLLALRRGADGRWLIAADLDSGNRRPER